MDVVCQCGAIRFKTPTPKPLTLYHCHCTECRKQSASAYGTSAIFPLFELPKDSPDLGVWTRQTDSGGTMDCYFCKVCGTRVAHVRRGGKAVSVKGGCIEGLDWEGAKHIFVRSAVVPIPEEAEKWEADPDFK